MFKCQLFCFPAFFIQLLRQTMQYLIHRQINAQLLKIKHHFDCQYEKVLFRVRIDPVAKRQWTVLVKCQLITPNSNKSINCQTDYYEFFLVVISCTVFRTFIQSLCGFDYLFFSPAKFFGHTAKFFGHKGKQPTYTKL